MTEEKTAAELDTLVKSAVEKLDKGSITMSDLLKALAPEEEVTPAPKQVPLPFRLTESQKAALDRATHVFGQVVPEERRALEPSEVSQLVEEKATLDELKKLAEGRHKDIRTIIFNHLDVEAERLGQAEDARRYKDGHYVLEGEVRGEPGTEKKFTREVSEVSPSLTESALKALAEDPEYPDFTHKDYLAMTDQVRVVNENKVMLALKKDPKLIHAIARATTPGGKRISMYARKA